MGLPEVILPKSRLPYHPHEYQTHCTEFILEKTSAGLFLDMGLGKSVITLTALVDLLHDRFEVSKVLVIAPLSGKYHMAGRGTKVEASEELKGFEGPW